MVNEEVNLWEKVALINIFCIHPPFPIVAFITIFIHVFVTTGTSELSVQKAKAEITRLIKEELIRLVSHFLLCLFLFLSILLSLYFFLFYFCPY